MKETKVRQSNFELMRIVSMFFIVAYHFFLHGKMIDNTSGTLNYIVMIFTALFMVHVNSFVLLTGYFNYEKKFKLSKIIRLNNSRLFYNIVIVIIFLLFGSINKPNIFYLNILSPIPRHWEHWFIATYILLYAISPVLNVIINNHSKELLKKIIIVLFIFNLLSYATQNTFYYMDNGFSLPTFIMLYFIGAYYHKYSFGFLKKLNKKRIFIISILAYVFLAVCSTIIYYFGKAHLSSSHEIIRYYANILSTGFSTYFNPLVIFGSIFYFIIFSLINIRSKIINFFGKSILGAYLITEHEVLRPWMYKFFGFNLKHYSLKHVLLAFLLSIGIIIICVLIEFLRVKVFEFFYNRKFAKKNRVRIQDTINKVGLNVQW